MHTMRKTTGASGYLITIWSMTSIDLQFWGWTSGSGFSRRPAPPFPSSAWGRLLLGSTSAHAVGWKSNHFCFMTWTFKWLWRFYLWNITVDQHICSTMNAIHLKKDWWLALVKFLPTESPTRFVEKIQQVLLPVARDLILGPRYDCLQGQ